MSDFLFNNTIQRKLNIPLPNSFNDKVISVTKTKGNSFISKRLSKLIYYYFKNNTPLKFKSGLSISYNDCTTYKDAIIKHANILSKISSQRKNITINGNKYRPITNDSFIRIVDSEFGDQYEKYCIINEITGKYMSSFVPTN